MAFNAIVAKLFWFGEVTGLNANNAMAWHETFGKLYWELSVTAIGCSAKGQLMVASLLGRSMLCLAS